MDGAPWDGRTMRRRRMTHKKIRIKPGRSLLAIDERAVTMGGAEEAGEG